MIDWMSLLFSLVAGAGLGLLYFGGLWLTVQKLLSARHPALLAFGSFLVRTAVVMAGFYFVMDGRFDRLVACLVGFIVARQLLMRILTPAGA